jgi:hypothetical protein
MSDGTNRFFVFLLGREARGAVWDGARAAVAGSAVVLAESLGAGSVSSLAAAEAGGAGAAAIAEVVGAGVTSGADADAAAPESVGVGAVSAAWTAAAVFSTCTVGAGVVTAAPARTSSVPSAADRRMRKRATTVLTTTRPKLTATPSTTPRVKCNPLEGRNEGRRFARGS